MNYPVWDVPILGSGLVIALIAIFHVFISHFAVGGGFYLPMTESLALRKGRNDWLAELKKHSKFFLVLTGVFGAVTGVGIWFAIGNANPEATSTLIHFWVFAWGIEWVVFLVELSALAAYFYLWGRVSNPLHIRLGWLYAIAAWLSLFLINGILTFMLTPGQAWLNAAGTGNETFSFWAAFFNPTFWPSLIVRTLICLTQAGVFALVTASRIDGQRQPELKTEMTEWARRWLLPSFLLLPIALFWYLAEVPAAQRALLDLGNSTVGQGLFTLLSRLKLVFLISSAAVVAAVYLFTSKRNAVGFGLGSALGVAAMAYVSIGSMEMLREMLRKPYVVGQHMFSNGVRKSEVARMNRDGYLTNAAWVRPEERARWTSPDHGQNSAVPDLSRGELMFRGQCMACHTLDGYRGMRKLLLGRDHKGIANLIAVLHTYSDDSPYRPFMPPLVGTTAEVEALTDFLAAQVSGTNSVPNKP
jgi:cytochrome bd-type quinol oxidase subunit 1/mono/diheme cytochrome c family protein